MNPLIPYIDSKNLDRNGNCYTFYNDDILVYFEDTSVQKYKIINDKIYLSSDDFSVPSSPSGGGGGTCEPLVCDNILNIPDQTFSNRGFDVSVSSQSISISGTRTSGYTLYINNADYQTFPSGTYYFKLNQALPVLFYPANESYSDCKFLAGVTSISCTFSSNWNPRLVFPIGSITSLDISNLQLYISTEDNEFCSYGSSTDCSDSSPDVLSSVCYSYNDIVTIPHSLAGLSPFYCFLCVVIFLTLLYVPYKIFIRPFFKSKL